MNKAAFDLVIVGVGGQGTLLASKILGRLALSENCGVKVSEVHGMSQRGGSVITHVRVGDSVHSPIVSLGGADYLISFEALEASRAACYLKPGGPAIVNTQRILPMPVITGAATRSSPCRPTGWKAPTRWASRWPAAARRRSTSCFWACSAVICPSGKRPGRTPSRPAFPKRRWRLTWRPSRAAAH